MLPVTMSQILPLDAASASDTLQEYQMHFWSSSPLVGCHWRVQQQAAIEQSEVPSQHPLCSPSEFPQRRSPGTLTMLQGCSPWRSCSVGWLPSGESAPAAWWPNQSLPCSHQPRPSLVPEGDSSFRMAPSAIPAALRCSPWNWHFREGTQQKESKQACKQQGEGFSPGENNLFYRMLSLQIMHLLLIENKSVQYYSLVRDWGRSLPELCCIFNRHNTNTL